MKDYEKAYKDVLNVTKELYPNMTKYQQEKFQGVCPELAESEDEKIRKEMLDFFRQFEDKTLRGVDISSWISWLEKQGEHANFRNKIQIGDKVTRNEDGMLVNLSQLNRVAKKDEKQGEQKETLCDKCKKAQPSHSCQDITALGRCALEKQGEQKPVEPNWIHHKVNLSDCSEEYRKAYYDGWNNCNIQHDQCKSEQKPVEMIQWKGDNLKEVIDFTGKSDRFDEWFKNWEEFEEYVHKHGNILMLFDKYGSHYEVPVGAWIVKTPDGYNVPSVFTFKQKPVEWSEEDADNLKETIYFINEFQKSNRCKNENDMQNSVTCENWLKSLRPQNTWKPSDEQMEAIEHFVRSIGESGYASPYENNTKLLYSLLEQLKKLREE